MEFTQKIYKIKIFKTLINMHAVAWKSLNFHLHQLQYKYYNCNHVTIITTWNETKNPLESVGVSSYNRNNMQKSKPKKYENINTTRKNGHPIRKAYFGGSEVRAHHYV